MTNRWKWVALALAFALAATVLFLTLVVSGLMEAGWSLL